MAIGFAEYARNPKPSAYAKQGADYLFGNIEVGVAFCSGGGYDHDDRQFTHVPPNNVFQEAFSWLEELSCFSIGPCKLSLLPHHRKMPSYSFDFRLAMGNV